MVFVRKEFKSHIKSVDSGSITCGMGNLVVCISSPCFKYSIAPACYVILRAIQEQGIIGGGRCNHPYMCRATNAA